MAEVRLIDANALIEEICKDCNAIKDGLCEYDICASVQWVSEAPTIDAVPVVRCKECDFIVEGNVYPVCACWGRNTDYEGFCHMGERREENAAD